MFVLDAMQRHADERHLHYNAVGLACLLIPKLRKEIEANHEDVKREYGMPDKKKNAGTNKQLRWPKPINIWASRPCRTL